MMNLTGVPFEIPNVSYGFKVVKGVLRVRERSLVLEFEVKDVFGLFFKSDLREEVIPIKNLDRIEWKRGWFQSVFIIGASSMKVFADIPGSKQGKINLKIKRPYRADAERLILRVRLIQSELLLANLENN